MNQTIITTAVIALLIGSGAGYMLGSQKAPAPLKSGNDMQAAMDDMMANLSGKTGDAFDKAFLSEMIMHHEGAVLMAEAAKENAAHAEIKTMADAIISAQTAEIAQMRAWEVEWYGEASDHTSH